MSASGAAVRVGITVAMLGTGAFEADAVKV
jgi:hypothetical protein